MGLPNMYPELNFNDFLLFSRIAKQIAKEVCLLMETPLDELVSMVEKDDVIIRKRIAISSKPKPVQRKILINTICSKFSLDINTAEYIVDGLINGRNCQ